MTRATFEIIDDLLEALDVLPRGAARRLMAHLEDIHECLQITDEDPEMKRDYGLNDLALLDAVREMLHTSHDLPMLSTDEIRSRARGEVA